MAAAVITVAEPATVTPVKVRSYEDPRIRIRYYTITADTGDYAAGGFTITASSLGLKTIYWAGVSGGIVTQGTAGASGVGVGIRYGASDASIIVQLYEVDTAGDGAPFQEKGDEAYAANFTFRLRVEGI